MFTSRLHPFKEQRLVSVGDNATLVFHDCNPDPAQKLVLYDNQTPRDDHHSPDHAPVGTPILYPPGEPLRNECRHFLECVATGRKPCADGRQRARVVELLTAGSASINAGYGDLARTPASLPVTAAPPGTHLGLMNQMT